MLEQYPQYPEVHILGWICGDSKLVSLKAVIYLLADARRPCRQHFAQHLQEQVSWRSFVVPPELQRWRWSLKEQCVENSLCAGDACFPLLALPCKPADPIRENPCSILEQVGAPASIRGSDSTLQRRREAFNRQVNRNSVSEDAIRRRFR